MVSLCTCLIFFTLLTSLNSGKNRQDKRKHERPEVLLVLQSGCRYVSKSFRRQEPKPGRELKVITYPFDGLCEMSCQDSTQFLGNRQPHYKTSPSKNTKSKANQTKTSAVVGILSRDQESNGHGTSLSVLEVVSSGQHCGTLAEQLENLTVTLTMLFLSCRYHQPDSILIYFCGRGNYNKILM